MIVLGIDPGATTGWCAYDVAKRCVVMSGWVQGHDADSIAAEQIAWDADTIVVERPVAHGPTRPQVVDCAYVCGRLVGEMGRWCKGGIVELTRLQVKQALTAATHGEVRVVNDATAWAALLLLHGGDAAAKKGGPLHGVKSHGRAALAVAVAWCLMQHPDDRQVDEAGAARRRPGS